MSATVETFYSRIWSHTHQGAFVRPITRAGGWSRIRVGMLCALSGAESTSNKMHFGFCNNDAGNIPGSGFIDHFLGFYGDVTWAYSSGRYSSGIMLPAHQVGATLTTGSGSAGFDIGDLGSFDHVAPYFVDIVKGTPYTLRIVGYDTAPTGLNSYPVATFEANMGYNGNLDTVSVPGGFVMSSTFTVDEASDGDLDHICFYWGGYFTAFTIDEIAYSQF